MAANMTLHFADGWRFHKGDLERMPEYDHEATYGSNMAGYSLSLYHMFGEDVQWMPVNLPHDWLADEPFDTNASVAGGYRKRETGWYYLEFSLPTETIEEALLVFDGVMGHSTVYVNQTLACRNFSGYNRFSCDVAPYLLEGEKNTIAIYVDGRKREGWWYEGAGIYRPVHLELRHMQKFDSQDYFIRSETTDDGFAIRTNLKASGIDGKNLAVTVMVTDAEGKTVAQNTVPAQAETELLQQISQPHLWSPETPYLYTVTCTLSDGEMIYDTITQKTGLRTVEWKADGMYLNGARYQIKGICCHQDHAGVGAAVPKELVAYRIGIIKDLGANAYRCAHHAVSEDVLSLCDEMGLLVMAENRSFSVCPDVLYQLDSMIRHARNHSCVFMYSLFNEERWQGELRGKRLFEKMKQYARKFDNTRILVGAQSRGALNDGNAVDAMDIVGTNYNLPLYDEIHKKYPDKCILGTENCPTLATRGIYKTQGNYYDCYGENSPDFSRSIRQTFQIVNDRSSFVAGCFPWSAFDYRGEPNPKEWPSISSHWGFTDLCGFYKDTAYLLMAYYKEALFVHLFPHWNWERGQLVRVCAFTNADTAELFLNGNSLGVQTVDDHRVEWQVPFEAGEIAIVAKKGDTVVSDTRHTVGKAYGIKLEDHWQPGSTLHIVNVFAVDCNGDVVPDYCGLISFAYPEGANLGLGNGDPTNHYPEHGDKIPFFNGMAQIVLRADAGVLTAQSEGLVSAEISLA